MNKQAWRDVAIGLAIALVLALLSPAASSLPDGLEWIAEQFGFINKSRAPAYSLIPDYVVPGVENEALATALAGVLGVFIVTALLAGIAVWLRRSSRKPEDMPSAR